MVHYTVVVEGSDDGQELVQSYHQAAQQHQGWWRLQSEENFYQKIMKPVRVTELDRPDKKLKSHLVNRLWTFYRPSFNYSASGWSGCKKSFVS